MGGESRRLRAEARKARNSLIAQIWAVRAQSKTLADHPAVTFRMLELMRSTEIAGGQAICSGCGVAIEQNEAGWWEVGTCRSHCPPEIQKVYALGSDQPVVEIEGNARPHTPCWPDTPPLDDPAAIEKWLQS